MGRRAAGARGLQKNLPQFLADRAANADVRHDAASEKRVVPDRCLVRSRNWSMTTMSHGLYFSCNEPTALTLMIQCDAEFFHGPDVGAMIQFAGQNPVAASVARQKNHVASGEFAGEQIIGRRAERRFDLHPFLVGEAFEVVKSGAADDADSMF